MKSDASVSTKDIFLRNLNNIDKSINESRKLALEIRQMLKIKKEITAELKNYLNQQKMKETKIKEIVNRLKRNETIEPNQLEQLNPIEKEIVKVVKNEKMTPIISELVEKLIDLSDMVSGKTEVPFGTPFHVYEIFDPEIDY